ncbi:hypothetical protein QPK87_15040 [Kamptonema cortianum]|nr:hypothetical protein [Oscillatoria laete-virens]MDK3157879.1 hypothetical protein [Kamptonema cortianum]MDL5046009.1 hypothetical protein [Oscillatoria amoena NRMC-F 0135]MDL5052716.1 hypothetical protein [Oscillatoria laete-virens NRMC-F 0139]
MSDESLTPEEVNDKVKMINLKWLTKGDLSEDAHKYIARLEKENFDQVTHICHVALACAREASARKLDPKPFFYAGLFSRTTPEERQELLGNNKVTFALVESIDKPESLAENLSFMHTDQLAQFEQVAAIIREKVKSLG